MRGRSLLYPLVAILFALGVAAWMLALPGANYAGPWGQLWRLLDSIYFALQLFGGGFSDFALGERKPVGTNGSLLLLLSIVRFLAFSLGIFLALLALVSGFRARVFAWGARLSHPQFDLVIGYGQVGRGLALALVRSATGAGRVIALCRGPSEFDQREARRQGIELYAGDARELARTRRLPAAPLERARRIFVAAGSDTETLAIARELAVELPDRADRIWMNFEDRMLLERLRDLPNPPGGTPALRPQASSMAEATAEFLVTRYRPMLTARAAGQARLHAVLIGFDHSTWPVAEQLVLNGTFPPPTYARPRLTIIDADGDQSRRRWQARHAALARWADIDFLTADPATIGWTRDDALLRAVEDLDPPSLYVFARNAHALPSALGLHHAMAKGERAPARIFVIANTRSDEMLRFGDVAADLLDDVVMIGDPAQVAAVGVACNMAITELAAEMHRRYAPDLPFAALSETLRISNRRAAIHSLDKLALLGFEATNPDQPGFGLSQAAAHRLAALIDAPDGAALDRLAGFEHVRWCVDRVIDGWRAGPRDDAARRREQLDFGGARYAELAASERAKDRDQIEVIAQWAQSRGGPGDGPLRIVERPGPPAQWQGEGGALTLALSVPPPPELLAVAPGEACRLLIDVPAEPPLAPGEGANARANTRRAAYAAFARALYETYPAAHFRLLRAVAQGHDWLGAVDAGRPVDGATRPPFTIGFAGPRAFAPTAAIIAKLEAVIDAQAAQGRPLRLVTGMAIGADALMIGLCRTRMRVLGIATGAAEETPQAALCHHVDHGVVASGDPDIYTAVARRILSSCHLLVAIDDGAPSGGAGGTADTVAHARALGRPVVIVSTADA